MQLISNNASKKNYSETEPILHGSIVGEVSDEVSDCDIGTMSFVSSSSDDTGHLHSNVSCNLVIEDPPQCRICLDVGDELLIAPCYCKGTQKYVHRSCIDNWRSTKEGFAFSHCTECRALFMLRANVPPDRRRLRLKFQFLVARDHALIFVVVQLIVAFLGLLVYKFYGAKLKQMFGYEERPYAFYTLAALSIVLVGLLYGFFIAIICGQRINERHYNVLAKQELTNVLYLNTKDVSEFRALHFNVEIDLWTSDTEAFCLNEAEYIVEDRDKMGIPELDPSHVSELRTLGLY